MIDFVLNKELEKYAEEFGFSEIKCVDIIKTEDKKDINKLTKDFNVVEGNYKINREILKNKRVNILLNPANRVVKDSLHFRNSGLDQISCRLAAKNKTAIGFSFNEILKKEGMERAELIGRIMQNVKLCRKYKVKMILGSFASTKDGLRDAKDLQAFGRLIGIDKLENENVFKYKEFTDIIEIK